MKNIPTLSDINIKNKFVLLRSDLNSDIKDGKILPSERIKQSAITIKELKKKGAKVVIIAHQGRPDSSDFTSLYEHSKQLNKYIKVMYVNDLVGEEALGAIKNLMPGEALLLDNIRFNKDEMNPSSKKNSLVEFFCKNKDFKFEYYINDAFSVCHREQTSITEFPKHIKSVIGRVMERELAALENLRLRDANCLFILGGAKPEDNIKLLKSKNKIITGGIFGQVCTLAKGKNLGAQNKFLAKQIKDLPKIITKIKPQSKSIQTPSDFAVKGKNDSRIELKLEEFPSQFEIYDIGKITIDQYVKEISKAKAVYMKGPLGYCEDEKFSTGTITILNEIAKRTKENKLFSLIGGGHLSNAFARANLNEKDFSHISLSGGALLSFIAGEKLPGLEVLKK
ncbi:phosphoglycerate kinase [Candidatus Pacearchaeota archaeon CG10_big_fil_rev_8_21_14_0_10_32_14]|nr:MAG: phosphoglycerate kinase [Candidatus Pacearchaeota archaeon CG10_big_fil_rev_8_21_14_0_10_32_14]